MNLNYFNLCHLLELGFRFPEVGAVNFNVIYLILKTIIRKQGLEKVKPADVIKSKQSSTEGIVTYLQEIEAVYDENENGFLPALKKVTNVENEISDVNEKIELLMERISDLEEKFTYQDGKKRVEDTVTLKQTDGDLGKLFADISMLKTSNSNLSLNAEELNKMVTKTMNIEDKVEALKKQVDKLDMYIYSERYEPKEDFNAPCTEVVTPAVELKPEMVKKQYTFAEVVRELMSLPKENKVELIDRTAEEQVADANQVKLATRKAYEKFLDIAKKVKSGKKEDDKPAEEAKTIHVAQLQEQAILPATDYTSTEVKGPFFRCQPRKKFKTLVHAITLAKSMQKPKSSEEDIPSATPLFKEPERDEIQSKVKSKDSMETALLDPVSSSERGIARSCESSSLLLEDGGSPAVRSTLLDPISCSEHGIVHPRRRSLLSEDGGSSAELKQWFVIYLRKQLDGMEATFLNKMKMVEQIQQETRNTKEQMQGILDRLAVEDISLSETKETISIIEKMTQELESGIQNVKMKLEHKPSANNLNISITKKDLGVLEDKVYEINEITHKDISAFKIFINNTLKRFQAELDDKLSHFEVNMLLEPFASRLKRLEKRLKDICLKLHMLEFEHIGPIDIKQYVHCIDGTRVKPIQRLPTHCASETQSVLSMKSAQSLLDEDVPQKIPTSVQRRLKEASICDSKQNRESTHSKPLTEKQTQT